MPTFKKNCSPFPDQRERKSLGVLLDDTTQHYIYKKDTVAMPSDLKIREFDFSHHTLEDVHAKVVSILTLQVMRKSGIVTQ